MTSELNSPLIRDLAVLSAATYGLNGITVIRSDLEGYLRSDTNLTESDFTKVLDRFEAVI